MSNNSIVLCIIDGWGIGESCNDQYNAIKQGNAAFWDYLLSNFPNSVLDASGESVGLPVGQIGNSEVGHMTIGGGRVILQDLPKINEMITSGEFQNFLAIKELISFHKNNNKSVHLLGLCSDGGVHSHINHLLFIASLLADNKINVKLHLFLDGRDVAPNSAGQYLREIDSILGPYVSIATIMGRFYAMDRDKRMDRTDKAYQAIVHANAPHIQDWNKHLSSQYQSSIYDEFICPVVMGSYKGFESGDSFFITNFRSDRARQITQYILQNKELLTYKISMTNYSKSLNKDVTPIFEDKRINNTLGQVVSLAGKKQLRIAETEKYAHVTFFFNAGIEESYIGEERIMIPSPQITTYDQKPEMSAFELTDKLKNAIKSKNYDLIIVNYANADMVGHTGVMSAAVKAVEVIDKCLKEIYDAVMSVDGTLIVTADHGNIEYMIDHKNNIVHTAHTNNPVAFILASSKFSKSNLILKKGDLSNIAPTILELMKIDKPKEMTSNSLIEKNYAKN